MFCFLIKLRYWETADDTMAVLSRLLRLPCEPTAYKVTDVD